ncbi:unnamed protein product [Lymnaea stagnalis]|uniref:Ankyrin repeat protein n=1 Tax=Lymnaea stagnalis TaxID=6523 RepID=A0AAV2HBZ8_LYMST
MIAAENGLETTVELLCEKGASVNEIDQLGWTALMKASQNGHFKVVKILADRGANLNNRNVDDMTSAMIASLYGHTQVIEILIEKGANINETNKFGLTALIIASYHGNSSIVEVIVNANGDNVQTANNIDRAWFSGLKSKRAHVAELLTKRGGNATLVNKHGMIELIKALEYKTRDAGELYKKIEARHILTRNESNCKYISNLMPAMIKLFSGSPNDEEISMESSTEPF